MKNFSVVSGDGYAIVALRIPQAKPSPKFCLTFAGLINDRGGWVASIQVGQSVYTRRFSRTPGRFIGSLLNDLKKVKLALTFRPVYAEWNNYWMVDHVDSWGVKRFSTGYAYLKWRTESIESQDENRFSCGLTDRESYEIYLEAVEAEKADGYRRTSRDYGLEAFENGGYW